MQARARQAWLVAGAGLLLLGLAFKPEIGAAVRVWNQSTAYGHCWLVLPIACWLLWERRAVVEAVVPQPTGWAALACVPVALVWVAANWLGIMEGRQLALVAFAELLLMAVFGWRLWWALSPAFLYLVFLVPFGAFLTPALQHFTTNFILAGLRVLDIPFDSDAFQITIPEGTFYVAEACAGLRFLIASVAFGVLYAVTIFRSPWRRAAFIAVSCMVPVVANGFRGLGIVVLGHVLGSAEAGAADHLIYGWVFFSFVIVMLALGGLPFREDWAVADVVPPPPAAARAQAIWPTPLIVLAFALSGPVTVWWMDTRQVVVAAIIPNTTVPVLCSAVSAQALGAVSTQTVRCGPATLQVIATTLPAGSNPARVIGAGRDAASIGLVGEVDSQVITTQAGSAWIVLSTHAPDRVAAYTILFAGKQLTGNLRDRLTMAGLGGSHLGPSLAIAVRYDRYDGGRNMLRIFLDAQAFRTDLTEFQRR